MMTRQQTEVLPKLSKPIIVVDKLSKTFNGGKLNLVRYANDGVRYVRYLLIGATRLTSLREDYAYLAGCAPRSSRSLE